MNKKNKLELYGTLGPSCCSKEVLKEMFQAGMTGLRLNLSHTNLKDCESWLRNLYEVSEEMRIVPDLLVDLQGPELRIGVLDNPIYLQSGSEVRFWPIDMHTDDEKKTQREAQPSAIHQNDTDTPATDTSNVSAPSCAIPVPVIPIPPEVFTYLENGQTLRMDDGKILCKVKNVKKDSVSATSAPTESRGSIESTESTKSKGVIASIESIKLTNSAESSEATAEVLTGGILKSRKSLAIDGCSIDLPTLTLQDLENLKVLRKYRVTGVMLPFVRSSQDLITLKKVLIDQKLTYIRIFAKIENQKGVEQLSSLLPHCDKIVIARGDLGNA
ncbi:MAG: pyruvate kinase, partial [Clostridiales bacterium]|nr:pyruvate kinase [Clostridiales bacterium]